MSESNARARNRWVGIIVGLLVVNVLATVVLAVKAGIPKTVPGYHELAPPSKATK